MRNINYWIILAVMGLLQTSSADVTPNALFGNHAVLQQQADVPIWGTAGAGEKVSVTIAGRMESTVAKDGKWMVRFTDLKPGGPYTLTITGDNTLVFKDILVGEVWLCSGQSNMERQLGPRGGQQPLINWEQEAAAADYPLMRVFRVATKITDQSTDQVQGAWVVCTPQTAPNFTAVGYYFGRDLLRQQNVPVGLIQSALGGTKIQAWMRIELLETLVPEEVKAYRESVRTFPAREEQFKKDQPRLMAEWEQAAKEAEAKGTPLGPWTKPRPPTNPHRWATGHAVLYNGMLAPLMPYAIRGTLWYQGESNDQQPGPYDVLFPAMIADWREQWGQDDFPFLFVQIAPHQGMSPKIRDDQFLSWKKTTNTAMVVTTDVGDATDIHPTRKEPVGQRLYLAARALAYGEDIEYSGPAFETANFDQEQAVVSFTHIGGGLMAKGGALRGFEVAGSDGTFFPAQAEIRGDTVVVTSLKVPEPTAVRYGWTNVPDVNLYNQEGLPASPFRTGSRH